MLQGHFFSAFWESCRGCWRKKQQHLLHVVASWTHVKNPSQLSRRVKIRPTIWENPFISPSDRKTGLIPADVWIINFFWGGVVVVHRSGSFSWFADNWREKRQLISENATSNSNIWIFKGICSVVSAIWNVTFQTIFRNANELCWKRHPLSLFYYI